MTILKIIGAILTVLSVISSYPLIGKDKLEIIETRITSFILKSYKSSMIFIVMLYLLLWIIMQLTIGGNGSFEDCIKPLFSQKITFPYSTTDTWFIGNFFILINIISWTLTTKIYIYNPDYFPFYLNQEKKETNKKSKKKVIEVEKKPFSLRTYFVINFLLGSLLTTLLIFSICRKTYNLSTKSLDNSVLFWSLFSFILCIAHLYNSNAANANNVKRTITFSVILLTLQIVIMTYFFNSQLFRTWNLLVVFPFGIYTFFNQFACLTNYSIKQLSLKKELNDIENRFKLYPWILRLLAGIIGLIILLI
jgi:hypothetical protein